ncbi:hypothetical protein [Natrialba sp. PRR66]|uniref:hypothetical protein n=1 Tax=Natrialba sp. PRR66 TaxID=3098146 RepID=UPI002B1E6275|nr:hypothetical protein [Natrialba sp. PRR66]
MNESRFYAADWLGVGSNWGTLDPGGDHLSTFSTDKGLYRVRHPARPGLEYIGETGRSLRGRVRALAHGAFAEEMPYRDPQYRHRRNRHEALLFSYSKLGDHDAQHKREEVETELIGVHWLKVGESPQDQF